MCETVSHRPCLLITQYVINVVLYNVENAGMKWVLYYLFQCRIIVYMSYLFIYFNHYIFGILTWITDPSKENTLSL